jgi:hypothetical protein
VLRVLIFPGGPANFFDVCLSDGSEKLTFAHRDHLYGVIEEMIIKVQAAH